MTVKEAKKLVKARLSEERFYHTKCVAKAAKKLAPEFGADVDKAVLAAWLHDILKEDPKPDLLKRVQASAIIFGYKSNQNKMVKTLVIGFALYMITQVVTLGIIFVFGLLFFGNLNFNLNFEFFVYLYIGLTVSFLCL